MKSNRAIIIMAGGKGKRMKSDLPKPLHLVGGKPAILRIIDAATSLSDNVVIVVGNQKDVVINTLGDGYRYALQEEQRGTGHAVLAAKEALEALETGDTVFVLPGDHPLLTREMLEDLFASHSAGGTGGAKITVSSLTVPDFEGSGALFSHHGRIRRDAEGNAVAIVEAKDATPEELKIPEVNIGVYCFDAAWLRENLGRLTDKNAAGELYITDLVGIARDSGVPVNVYRVTDPKMAMGFNTPEELAAIDELLKID